MNLNLNFIFFFNSILLGVGLAMDAFSVSVANGLSEPSMKGRKMCFISGVFGFFQALMPLLGYFCVHTIIGYFGVVEMFVPWIALGLLLYIGGKMLYEGIKHKDDKEAEKAGVTVGALLIQGIATSIDALSVGFTISDYEILEAVIAALIIAVVTFIISFVGIIIGKNVGNKLSGKAEIVGGAILIFIGLEIFITSWF